MTTVLIILSIHSILFLMLHTRIYVHHQENRKALKRVEASLEGVIADREEERRGFREFFVESVIPRMPADVLQVLTEEQRRYCARYMLETPRYYEDVRFKNTDLGCESENTYSVSGGELFVDGMPVLEFFKTLPKIDYKLAGSAAFAKWPEAYLRALAAQYFNPNNQA